MHLSEDDIDSLSIMSSTQEISNGSNQNKNNVDLYKEYPDIFKKTARVRLERVDTMENPMKHVGEINKKVTAKGNLLNGSAQLESKKSKRGMHLVN